MDVHANVPSETDERRRKKDVVGRERKRVPLDEGRHNHPKELGNRDCFYIKKNGALTRRQARKLKIRNHVQGYAERYKISRF